MCFLPPLLQIQSGLSAELQGSLDACEAGVRACNTSPDAPLVLYVSKMVAVPANALPRWEAGALRPPASPAAGAVQSTAQRR